MSNLEMNVTIEFYVVNGPEILSRDTYATFSLGGFIWPDRDLDLYYLFQLRGDLFFGDIP